MTTPGTASTSDARKRAAERLTVTVTVDTDELREWADRHADMGNHGVAHVLYQAAKDGESLGEQAIREAEQRGAVEALRNMAQTFRTDAAEAWGYSASWLTNGTSVAELAATWCLDRADHLADGGAS